MNKNAYYLMCMARDVYSRLDWCISVFAVVDKRPLLSEAEYEYQIIYDPADEESLFCAVKVDGVMTSVKIEGSSTKIPLYNAKSGLDIVEGDLPLTTGDINTSYGIILGNMYLLYYPFGSKFKFVNDVIDGSFDKAISKLLSDDPVDGSERKPNKIYVDEFVRYGEACGAIAGMDKLFSTGGSINTLSIHPSVIQLRDKLIKQHAHELDDIRVQASIEAQLVAADKASFKGDDDALDFLISRKSFNPTRKKQLILIGGSAGFGGASGGTSSFIPTSLKDGWRIQDLPTHANEARAGSFFRGKETAEGGTEVKNGTRMSMNFRIVEEFCGSKRGIPVTIFKDTVSKYIGLFIVGNSGPVEITKENVDQYIDKEVMTHSPMYCLMPGDSYCKYCIGNNWTLLKDGLSTAITNVGDVYMASKMGRMHGVALVESTFHWHRHLG